MATAGTLVLTTLQVSSVTFSLLLLSTSLLLATKRDEEERQSLIETENQANANLQKYQVERAKIALQLLRMVAPLVLFGISVYLACLASDSPAMAKQTIMASSAAYSVLLEAVATLVTTGKRRQLRKHAAFVYAASFMASLSILIGDLLLQDTKEPENSLMIAQSVVATLVLFQALATPSGGITVATKKHPRQTSSPLSRVLFLYLDSLMWRYLRVTRRSRGFDDNKSKVEQESDLSNAFESLVPNLPDGLQSAHVLQQFRWAGDAVGHIDEARSSEDGEAVVTGRLRAFAYHSKFEILTIFCWALVWTVSLFVSPLCLNKLLQYVQSQGQPSSNVSLVSPYIYVVGLLLGPTLSSIALQNSLFGIALIGLRLRTLLSHAIYTKVLRMGPTGKSEDSVASTGKANNLLGSDIDTITSSLELAMQLIGIPFKLAVSLTFLYSLLGWSAFVALAVLVLFTPLSAWVSSRYGSVQEKIMKRTDARVNLFAEIISSIRMVKYLAWEKPLSDKIDAIRSQELSTIVSRASYFAGMMLLSTGIPAAVSLLTLTSYTYLQGQVLTASVAFTSLTLFGFLREAIISATYLTSAFMRLRVSLHRIATFLDQGEELESHARTFEGDDIEICKLEAAWQSDGTSDWTLRIDDLRPPKGKLTVIAGPVASGKSTLLHALLGEVRIRSGEVRLPARISISYAGQSPWLGNLSIRDNILAGSPYDDDRYHTTLYQCALTDLNDLPNGDLTLVGEKAGDPKLCAGVDVDVTRVTGPFSLWKARVALAAAVYAKSDICLLDGVLSSVDSGTRAHLIEKCLRGTLLVNRTVLLAVSDDAWASIPQLEHIVVLDSGRIKYQGHPKRHQRPSTLFNTSSARDTTPKSQGGEKSDVPKAVQEIEAESMGSSSANVLSWKTYATYLGSMGRVMFWTSYTAINVVAHLLMLATGFWTGIWTDAADRRDHLGYYLGIWAAIQLLSGIFLTTMYLFLIGGAIRASRKLHKDFMKSILHAPLSIFDTIPVGRFVNRASKDMQTVDTDLVESIQPIFDYAPQILFLTVTVVTILPIFLIPAGLLAISFYFVAYLYVTSALTARRHVAVARSPLLSTLGDAVSGGVTIRAFGRQTEFLRTFRLQTDHYNRMEMHEFSLDRWLAERSDIVGSLVAFLVGILALSGSFGPGIVGFLLSSGLDVTARILYVVTAINRNELNFNSAARVIEYSYDLAQEDDQQSDKADGDWPSRGAIKIENLSVRYDETTSEVLHDVTAVIASGKRIALVGQSGCGKSTLTLALLRAVKKTRGRIEIDGRDIETVPLEMLRSRITIIPQEAVLLSGTIRFNLDPTGHYGDDELWRALKLSGFAKEGSEYDLDHNVTTGGENLSLGQRQLLCLSRALIRKSRFIIFDEVSANVDLKSDKHIQRVMREELVGTTCLTIAHRLNTTLDYDEVWVMKNGRIIESGSPTKLRKTKGSLFQQMCKQSGI